MSQKTVTLTEDDAYGLWQLMRIMKTPENSPDADDLAMRLERVLADAMPERTQIERVA